MTTTKKKPYPIKRIDLEGNRKLINAVEAAGLTTENPFGGMKGRYPIKLRKHVVIESVGDMRKWNKIKKEFDAEPPTPKKTPEQIREEWAKRLVRLLPDEVTLEEALVIADEKLEYRRDEIQALEMRQNGYWSDEREKLIRKMKRENPLRRIKDVDHAENILAASERHNQTDYDKYLARARQLADEGIILRSEVKRQARMWAREDLEEVDDFDFV